MSAMAWWQEVAPVTREWLIANNGSPLPAPVAAEITAAGGTAVAGVPLTDDQVDWIEAVANDEAPPA